MIRPRPARDLLQSAPVLVAHAGLTAADKNGNLRPRSPRLFDARASDRHQQLPAGQERPDPGRRPE